ncbi:uncharacterized protein [Branchiostoma lanceolatum]|uniref:uncharacterized protein n=1 Tax=Branchiostoma lanceolatum TaxID=7740 RepID=UPI003451667E
MPEPTTEAGTDKAEQLQFFYNISNSGSHPQILSLVPPFNDNYVTREAVPVLPTPLSDLYDENCAELSFNELCEKCEEISIALTPDETQSIEENTRLQSKSALWYKQRAGRITASNLKSACHTDPDKPSMSIIKKVCYPESQKFASDATDWGQCHEATGRDEYIEKMMESHEGFVTFDSGFHINNEWPYLGATPDGLVECKCCGKGVCEIKCPFNAKDLPPTDLVNTRNFCLKETDHTIHLDQSHTYYYQVQAQMFICDVEYCDFVVWTKKGVYIERILPNAEFWSNMTLKSKKFFDKAILPEIVGKWFSKTESSG